MLFIFFILIVLSVLIKKPACLPFFVILFLVKINFNGYYVSDFSNYNQIYNQISPTMLYQTGYGWYFLNNLGRNLGLDYNQYKALTILICGLILWFVSYKLIGESSNFVAALYLLYPALVDTVQIRFFTAITIVAIGIIFLVKREIKYTVIFIGIVLIASTIHTSALFYILFAAAPFAKKHQKFLAIIVLISSLILIIFKSKFYGLVSSLANERQLLYFDPTSGVTSGSGFLLLIAILSIIAMFIINNQIKNIIVENDSFSLKDQNVSFTIEGISLVMFLLIPLIILSGEFYRVFRILFPLNYVLIAILIRNKSKYVVWTIVYDKKKILINPKILGILIAVVAFLVNILYLTPAAFYDYF